MIGDVFREIERRAIADGYRAAREAREATARARNDKMIADWHGAQAGRNHPLLTPNWRVTLRNRRIDQKLWLLNPNMIRGASGTVSWDLGRT